VALSDGVVEEIEGKQKMKKTIAILLVLMMCVLILTACGGKEEPQPQPPPTRTPEPAPMPEPEPTPEPIDDITLEGFYTLIKYDTAGNDLLEIAEDSGESTLYIYIEFRNDGTAHYFFMDEGGDIAYKVSGNQVTLIFDVGDDNNELVGTIKDDTITFEQEGMVMVYKLNPEFVPGEISMDEDIIPPGFYTLIEAKADDGRDLMPNIMTYERDSGIDMVDANHIKILSGNRFEWCTMQFEEDYVLNHGEIYFEEDTIIIHVKYEGYDDDYDEIYEAELNGDVLTIYVTEVVWFYERNDDYHGRD